MRLSFFTFPFSVHVCPYSNKIEGRYISCDDQNFIVVAAQKAYSIGTVKQLINLEGKVMFDFINEIIHSFLFIGQIT